MLGRVAVGDARRQEPLADPVARCPLTLEWDACDRCEDDREARPLPKLDVQAERALGRIGQHVPRPFEQNPHLGLSVRRPDVRHDLPSAAVGLGNLHDGPPRRRPNPPNPCHDTEPWTPISA